MKMNKYVISAIGLILMAIILFIFAGVQVRKDVYSNYNSVSACQGALAKMTMPLKNGEDCPIWDGSQCRKGTISQETCQSKGDLRPLFAVITGVVCIIVGIVLLYKNRKSV